MTELDQLKEECARLRGRLAWWISNAEGIAKERADAWTALVAIEPLFREDMPDGPEGQRGCATPEYRQAYRLLLASLKDREALLHALKPAAPTPETAAFLRNAHAVLNVHSGCVDPSRTEDEIATEHR